MTVDVEFDGPLEVAGVPTLSARVTPTGERTHLFAALSDVGPDGDATLLKDQVAANEITGPGRIEFDLHGVQREIDEGHTLRLTLTLEDDALTKSEPVPFDDGLYVDSAEPAGAVVHRSNGTPAELAFPVVE